MVYNYLPIGTVVCLTNATKKIMITGYNMQIPTNPGKIYDYSGCMFPEGVLRSDTAIVFDHTQIEKVYQEGYKDNDSIKFLNRIGKK